MKLKLWNSESWKNDETRKVGFENLKLDLLRWDGPQILWKIIATLKRLKKWLKKSKKLQKVEKIQENEKKIRNLGQRVQKNSTEGLSPYRPELWSVILQDWLPTVQLSFHHLILLTRNCGLMISWLKGTFHYHSMLLNQIHSE